MKKKVNSLFYVMVSIVALMALLVFTACGKDSESGKLVINTDTSDPAPKKAFQEVIDGFKAEYPEIEVEWNVFDHESFKTSVRNWLPAEPPDVITWYAGNRMAGFVNNGLLEDVSDVWDDNDMGSDFASTYDSLTIDGKQWGVPYTYYQWGVYYRKDIFEENGIEVPTTWDQFIEMGKTLNAAGVTPVAIGTKFLWTAAGWFDYLNLRVNGLEFHIDLMLGNVPYTDDRVRNTFKHWKQLVDGDFFLKNHTSYSWQEAQAFLYNGDAAMYLIGNFIVPNFTDEIRDKMGFFQFPIINPDVGVAEDAPTDTLHIPAKAKNKENAKLFLAYMARAESQTIINEALLQIPANSAASPADDPFLNAGAEMLAAADGTAQFYDRDTDPEMAKAGMKGFQEFMDKPENLDKILETLEKERSRIFQ